MNSSPRVAVCYFGITRAPELTVPSIEKNLVGPAREIAQVQTFAHLYQIHRIINPRNGEDQSLDAEGWRLLRPDVVSLETPEGAGLGRVTEMVKSYGDAFNNDHVSTTNLVLQLNSLASVFEMSLQHDPDIWIFARPDLQYHDGFKASLLRAMRSQKDTCVLPNWQEWRGGYNDRFAICTSEHAARAYARRIDSIKDFCDAHGPLHAELLLKTRLDHSGVEVAKMRLRASRVRAGGEVVVEEFRSTRRIEMQRSAVQSTIRCLDYLGVWRFLRPIARHLF